MEHYYRMKQNYIDNQDTLLSEKKSEIEMKDCVQKKKNICICAHIFRKYF